jgi:ABC-type multidrug transport system fused ATPase/permease subunit
MRDYNIKSLHSRMSIVSQSPALFEDSILENIAYSKDSVTMEQIKKASATANCDEFVAKFRTGWNTMVGSRGLQLSGGQRQRLAIARAALADPDILILDEATSALDAKNETLVKEALDVLMTDKTVIVIAHRLSTIRNADTIVCMRDGGIEEIGTHDELIAKKGF